MRLGFAYNLFADCALFPVSTGIGFPIACGVVTCSLDFLGFARNSFAANRALNYLGIRTGNRASSVNYVFFCCCARSMIGKVKFSIRAFDYSAAIIALGVSAVALSLAGGRNGGNLSGMLV